MCKTDIGLLCIFRRFYSATAYFVIFDFFQLFNWAHYYWKNSTPTCQIIFHSIESGNRRLSDFFSSQLNRSCRYNNYLQCKFLIYFRFSRGPKRERVEKIIILRAYGRARTYRFYLRKSMTRIWTCARAAQPTAHEPADIIIDHYRSLEIIIISSSAILCIVRLLLFMIIVATIYSWGGEWGNTRL